MNSSRVIRKMKVVVQSDEIAKWVKKKKAQDRESFWCKKKDGSSFAAWKWVESPCASCCQGESGTEDAEFITWERIALIERIGLSSVTHVDNKNGCKIFLQNLLQRNMI